MTANELIQELLDIGGKNIDKEIVSIGTVGGSDRDCDFVFGLEDGVEIKIGKLKTNANLVARGTKTVRLLRKRDYAQIESLDALSGFGVLTKFGDFEDDQEYAYGVFLDDTLVGYCTMGGADEIPEASPTDYLLSDVYIHPKYRDRGLGSYMVKNVLSRCNDGCTWAELLDPEVGGFYETLGFRHESEYLMNKGTKEEKNND